MEDSFWSLNPILEVPSCYLLIWMFWRVCRRGLLKISGLDWTAANTSFPLDAGGQATKGTLNRSRSRSRRRNRSKSRSTSRNKSKRKIRTRSGSRGKSSAVRGEGNRGRGGKRGRDEGSSLLYSGDIF